MDFDDYEEDSVRIYFDPDDWRKLNAYEKLRYTNLKRNYETLKLTGINPQMPRFMMPQKKRTPLKSSANDRKKLKATIGKTKRCKNLSSDLKEKREALIKTPKVTRQKKKIYQQSFLNEGDGAGFECDLCHSILASEEWLSRHRNSHPHRGHDRRHCCPNCPYSTDNGVNLRLHLRTHTGEKPHRCDLCGRRFARKDSLGRHLLIHSGERPFKCQSCKKTFNDASHLRDHERAHLGVRPYVCSTCGKRYIQIGQLRRHEMIHSGERPHRCPYCDYRATQKTTLQEHVVRIHTKEFQHVCPYCQKGFPRSKELKKHVDDEH